MRFAGSMGIKRFAPAEDPELARECYEIYRAACEVDAPETPFMPPRVFEGWLPYGYIGDPRDLGADRHRWRRRVVRARAAGPG
jgi:hypothetical protein